ncbi:protein phosphatase CheZ [Natronospirillum operosum]|uniref:Protein phosphatase CheZ n=1 Tax=Natronospirillum operosum TaxID=2759953 RepID=A0A4Z0WJH5_9GAMM|nr:protein phosphatase CheZ [Natronospirillum operosum]TGG95957.1 protein phosphatase CheZ [Natronospirillum operosum]
MTASSSGLKPEFEELLKDKAHELQASVEDGDFYHAVRLIQEIQDAREQTLYHEVGRLTRALHSAITNFHVDGTSSEGEIDTLSEMTDATDRLDHVIKMTEDAANRTMDKVDECMPLASDMGSTADALRGEWKRLVDRDMSPEEFRTLYWQMDEFLGRVAGDSGALYGHLSDILLAQDYQDLTGQLIQRVTGLVRDVEYSLVDLMRMAAKVEGVAGLAAEMERRAEAQNADQAATEDNNKENESSVDDNHQGYGPSIKKTDDVVSSQDEVDDLLSSLGF